MSTRASALRIEIDLTEQGAQTDFEVSQALRRLADQIAHRKFAGFSTEAKGELTLERNFGTFVKVGDWSSVEVPLTTAQLALA